MSRGHEDFLAPGSGAHPQDILMHQCDIYEGPKLWWLPMEGRNRTDGVASGLLHDLGGGKCDIARGNGVLQMPRNGILIPTQHDQHFFASVDCKNERFDHLPWLVAKSFRDLGSAFCRRWCKCTSGIRDAQGVEIVMDWQLHTSFLHELVTGRRADVA